MILYVGGHASGMEHIIKDKYADDCIVISGLHEWIREELERHIASENSYDVLTKMIEEKLSSLIEEKRTGAEKDRVIISSDLIGSGVVPVDSFDRCWREVTGRVLTDIAAGAEEVYRVICGIAQKLK